jgi:ribonuclease PH
MVALHDALYRNQEIAARHPVREFVAATSAGVVGRFPVLDLAYGEDSAAEVDLNVVMTESGRFVEIQGTAEGKPFERQLLDTLLDLGAAGVRELVSLQKAALGL